MRAGYCSSPLAGGQRRSASLTLPGLALGECPPIFMQTDRMAVLIDNLLVREIGTEYRIGAAVCLGDP